MDLKQIEIVLFWSINTERDGLFLSSHSDRARDSSAASTPQKQLAFNGPYDLLLTRGEGNQLSSTTDPPKYTDANLSVTLDSSADEYMRMEPGIDVLNGISSKQSKMSVIYAKPQKQKVSRVINTSDHLDLNPDRGVSCAISVEDASTDVEGWAENVAYVSYNKK